MTCPVIIPHWRLESSGKAVVVAIGSMPSPFRAISSGRGRAGFDQNRPVHICIKHVNDSTDVCNQVSHDLLERLTFVVSVFEVIGLITGPAREQPEILI